MRSSRRALFFMLVLLVGAKVCVAASPKIEWPPKVGHPYTDLELIDQEGRRVRLSEFKGRPILVEPVGMTCPACQAWSGAHEKGPYLNVRPQVGLDSFRRTFRDIVGVDLRDSGVVFIQILLYDMQMGPPSREDARKWAKHFGLEASENEYVLQGSPDLIGPGSYAMIPGFQLIDRDFILRYDSTGHSPGHDLYVELLPALRRYLGEKV